MDIKELLRVERNRSIDDILGLDKKIDKLTPEYVKGYRDGYKVAYETLVNNFRELTRCVSDEEEKYLDNLTKILDNVANLHKTQDEIDNKGINAASTLKDYFNRSKEIKI